MDRSDEREFFASCLAGMEQLVAEDLRTAGARRVRPLTGGVAFFAERKDVLAACLESRFVSRLTMVLGRIDASDDDALYRGSARLSVGLAHQGGGDVLGARQGRQRAAAQH